ncbi:MAG: tyrosine-type recombinase/integrase [SAR324 cluster bacterium]|jgi:site-specific recombinase XerD|nr:site-specific integrase [SAR324 cluster bacterium]MCH2266149.1 tyrosine-type recombinase/integrase [SAR324 cluster bacterium]
MKIISVEEQNSETLNPEAGAVAVKKPSLAPGEALNLVFGEYAANTQRAYARAFRNLQEWAELKELREMENFEPLRMLEFKNHLKSQGKKASTINQTMSALRKVCKVLTEFGYLKQNPFKASIIRAEKIDTATSKGALQVSQLNAMIEANQVMEYDVRTARLLRFRNGLVLKFLYLTAARRGEAADLRWDDIVQDGAFHVAVLRQTKSGKEQRIKLRQELYQELTDWWTLLQGSDIDSPHVFPSLGFRTLGHQMSGKGINDIVSRLGKAVGLDISAHYLRHTAITLALELGEPLQKVQSYARHASANTTIRYFHDRQLLEKNPTDRLPLI